MNALKKFEKTSAGKRLWRGLPLLKLWSVSLQFYQKKDDQSKALFCHFYEVFQASFFTGHLLARNCNLL